MIGQQSYAKRADEVIGKVMETQAEAVGDAAEIVAASIADHGVVHAFGTGHSRAIAFEVVGRAGGLIPTNALSIKDLVMYGQARPADILDPTIERDPTLAAKIWDLASIEPNDVLVVASNSGRNGSIVEMARIARHHGHPVIAITSMDHSSQVTSRHPSGVRLFELADVVLDNGAPYGDALMDAPGGQHACGISTITSALLVQMVMAETVRILSEQGREAPLYISANVPGGDEHNRTILESYGERVRRGEP